MQCDGQESTSAIISIDEALQILKIRYGNDQKRVQHLSGGLTNDNVLITLQEKVFKKVNRKIVLRRFCSNTSKHLGYNRDEEYRNSCLVAQVKQVGASVIGYVPPCGANQHGGALALQYIESNTLDESSIKELLQTSKGISLLVHTLKRLHATPTIFQNLFDPFKAREFYREQVRLMTGKDIPWANYSSLVKKLSEVEIYLKETREDFVDCHNDLLSANFLLSSDGSKLAIVDWELSGQAEPSWELGNFISENGLDEDEDIISSIINLYWSDLEDPEKIQVKIKKVKLFSLVSKITWSAWGCVLHNLDHTKVFDYEGWSMQKLRKAELALQNEDYINMLMQK